MVNKTVIVDILLSNGTLVDRLITIVTDIGSHIQAATALFDEAPVGLIASETERAFDITQNNLRADIHISAMIAVDAEITCIIEGALMIPVALAVLSDFFEDYSRVFIEAAGNILKGYAPRASL